jgi:hypothetical protein
MLQVVTIFIAPIIASINGSYRGLILSLICMVLIRLLLEQAGLIYVFLACQHVLDNTQFFMY